MSAPFEPNSINIIKMKGTEATPPHALQLLLSKALLPATPAPLPQQRPAEMPKSKYYFLQMESFHIHHNATKLRRFTLTWRHHLKCSLCGISSAEQACSQSYTLLLPSSPLCFFFLPVITHSLITLNNPFKQMCEHLSAWIYYVCRNRREVYPICSFRLEPVQLDRGAALMSLQFFQLNQSHMGSFNCTIINKIIFNVPMHLV